jgi:hypothetical protein
MDNEKNVKRSKSIVNILFAIPVSIVGAFILGLLYLQSLSPAMIFVNDTERAVNEHLLGGTSPSVLLDVAPGESTLIDMPSWWGTPTFPRNDNGDRVRPRWNLVVIEIYYLSDFPESWTRW